MAQCLRCGKKLGPLERIGDDICKSCEALARKEREQARTTYGQLVEGLANGSTALNTAVPVLRDITPKAGFTADELTQIHGKALRAFVDRILADEVLSEAETKEFVEATEAMGLSMTDLSRLDQSVMIRLVVAQANAGRLDELAEGETKLMLKRGELAHLEVPASLLKEIAKREYRGGYAGFSFRIAKGVRFHTGGTRGKSVVVGTEMHVEDTGTLIVSSKRVVFMGLRKSLEMPFSKLMGINVFTDGIQFNLSNRQRAPLFQVPSGDLVAAVVNTAAQKLQ